MANDYYQIYNHAYSFATSKVNSGGVTFSLPQNDYGIYGQHVDAYFNTISNSEGATGNLVAWFVSDKGLTYYTHSLGATAAITGYVESRFPVTSSTTGLGLVDLRGSPDWVKIIGDGIVGPTRGSTGSVDGTNSTQYVNGIKAVFGLLKNQYPNIEWAIAGLPHLPYQMVYAPPVGESPAWDPSLTNSGDYTSPAWWDPQHPTGSSGGSFYNWSTVPSDLKAFYEQIVTDGIQEMVFDNCNVGWVCPDIRVPYADSLPFYEYGYDPEANYKRNKRLCELAFAKSRQGLLKSYALISTMYPSRPLNQYDDVESTYGTSGSDYVGATANSSEGYYSSITYRYDMIQGAIDGGFDGFIFYDPAPSVIEMACTADIASGTTGYAAQIRARNMFSSMMYGGAYVDGFVPSGSGYADPCVKPELLRMSSKRTVGYLDDIRESVNLASYGSGDEGNMNGWIRGAQDPSAPEQTYQSFDTSKRAESDASYGQQGWQQKSLGGNICQCPPPPCDSTQNPYLTLEGANGCCCIQVYEIRNPNDNCPCPNLLVTTTPRNTPNCNQFADCTNCEGFLNNISDLLGGALESAICQSAGCYRTVTIQNNCKCITYAINQGEVGTQNSGSGGPSLGCVCGLNGTPILRQDCNNYANLVQNDYSFVLDSRIYERSSPNTNQFILRRDANQMYTNWRLLYEPTLTYAKYKTFVQAGETILNPSVSTAAIRTHSNKEVLRHLPNQYFTT